MLQERSRFLAEDCDTWVCHFMLELKQASREWSHSWSQQHKKIKGTANDQKGYANSVLGLNGLMHLEFLEHRKTIELQFYSDLLCNEVRNTKT